MSFQDLTFFGETEGQVDDLVGEINQRIEHGERVLVTTLTKMMLMVANTALPSGFIPNIDLTISKACGNDCARKKTQVMFINK